MTATVKTTEIQAAPAATEQKSDLNENIVKARQALEQERKARQSAEQELQQLKKEKEERVKRSKDDDDDDFGDEPYVDPRSFKKVLAKEKENIRKEVKEEVRTEIRQAIEQEKVQDYLKQNPEFEKTMAPENIQRFAEKFPSMAEAILKMPDGFERQRLVYEAIKSTGANKPPESQQSVQQKINANQRSPYYQPASSGTAPYNAVGDFSEAGQKNAFAKMRELQARIRL